VVKPLLSSHPQGISEWLLNRGTKLPNRGLPEISFRFGGKSFGGNFIYSVLAVFPLLV